MNWFEFILAMVCAIIIGIWGLLIIVGHYDFAELNKSKKKKEIKKEEK